MEEICHDGIVDSVENGTVSVRILQSAACAGCQARSLCRTGESKEKLIEVTDCDVSEIRTGQRVSVTCSSGQGMLAVLLAFGFPLLLLLVIVTVCGINGISDGVAAISAIAVLFPYYLVLFLCRGKLKKRFRFRITN